MLHFRVVKTEKPEVYLGKMERFTEKENNINLAQEQLITRQLQLWNDKGKQ